MGRCEICGQEIVTTDHMCNMPVYTTGGVEYVSVPQKIWRNISHEWLEDVITERDALKAENVELREALNRIDYICKHEHDTPQFHRPIIDIISKHLGGKE